MKTWSTTAKFAFWALVILAIVGVVYYFGWLGDSFSYKPTRGFQAGGRIGPVGPVGGFVGASDVGSVVGSVPSSSVTTGWVNTNPVVNLPAYCIQNNNVWSYCLSSHSHQTCVDVLCSTNSRGRLSAGSVKADVYNICKDKGLGESFCGGLRNVVAQNETNINTR